MIGNFFKSLTKRDLSSYEIFLSLKRIYNNECKFSIVNVQGGLRKTVGKVDNGEVQIDSSIVYFGGIQDLSNFTQAQIFVSANTGCARSPCKGRGRSVGCEFLARTAKPLPLARLGRALFRQTRAPQDRRTQAVRLEAARIVCSGRRQTL